MRHIYIILCIQILNALSLSAQDKLLDSLSREYHNSVSDTDKIYSGLQLAFKYLFYNPDSTIILTDEIIEQALSINDFESVVIGHNYKGIACYYKGEIEQSKKNYRYALIVATKHKVDHQKVALFGNFALLYKHLGMPDSAFIYFNKTDSLYTALEDSDGIMKVKIDKAQYLSRLGRLIEGLDLVKESIRYFSRKEMYFDLSIAYSTAGGLYLSLNDFANAIESYEQTLHYDTLIGRYDHIPSILMNIGAAYLDIAKDYEKADFYIEKSWEMAGKNEKESLAPYYYINSGGVYFGRKNYEEAIRRLRMAQNEYRAINSSYLTNKIYNIMADIFYHQGLMDSSYFYAGKALKIAQENQTAENLQAAHEILFRLDSAKGRFESALGHYMKATGLSDSLENVDYANKVADLNVRYLSELKSKENLELKLDNQEKQRLISWQRIIGLIISLIAIMSILFFIIYFRQHKKLRASNDQLALQHKEMQQVVVTRDKLFSIIAHDLRSPFNGLIGLLELIDTDDNGFDPEELKGMISKLRKRTQDTFRLLNNLLDWSVTQQGQIVQNPKPLLLADATQKAILPLTGQLTDKKQQLILDIDPTLKVNVDPRLFNPVIMNLLSNAIKYSNEGGRIRITAMKQDGTVLIHVIDNGIGMSNEMVHKLFSMNHMVQRFGTNREPGVGLGLVICYDFIGLMGGQLFVNSEEGKGADFFFTIPTA
jgi:signal transduction histidine kinase